MQNKLIGSICWNCYSCKEVTGIWRYNWGKLVLMNNIIADFIWLWVVLHFGCLQRMILMMQIVANGIFWKLSANVFIHCEWILLLKGFSMCKRSSWWKISVWRSFCRGAALVSCFGKALQRKYFLSVDAICIITSADKSFWIRQIMAAPVGNRVLNDELHFDTFSAPTRFHFQSVASICLYCDLSFTSLRFLPSLSWRVLFVSLPFACPRCGRLCVAAIPDAMMSPSPYIPLNAPWFPC